jgi:chemotaxis protein CheD
MRTERKGNRKRIIIDPGEYYVSSEHVIISTLLGSCVAACLYDPVQKIFGMNHFLLSNRRYAKDMPVCVTEAGRYGIYAMELLINKMMQRGAQRENLHAKAFGGGSMLQPSEGQDNFFCVGNVNTRFIREFLHNEGIPLVKSDLGGSTGRVIHFSYDEFSVYVRKIQKSRNAAIISKERSFWQKAIESQEEKVSEPDIWD